MITRWILPLPNPESPEVEESSDFLLENEHSLRSGFGRLRLSPLDLGDGRESGKLILTGELQCLIAYECARCLGPASAEVRASFTSMIDLIEGTVASKDLDTPPEPGGFSKVSEGRIDVTDEIQQQIFLAAPVTVLCSESCKGLCPKCGADLNKNKCSCPTSEGSGHFDGLAGLLD